MNVSISSRDNYCIEVVLRCLAVAGDGIGPHEMNDGGMLGTVMAAGFKGKRHYGGYGFGKRGCELQCCSGEFWRFI